MAWRSRTVLLVLAAVTALAGSAVTGVFVAGRVRPGPGASHAGPEPPPMGEPLAADARAPVHNDTASRAGPSRQDRLFLLLCPEGPRAQAREAVRSGRGQIAALRNLTEERLKKEQAALLAVTPKKDENE